MGLIRMVRFLRMQGKPSRTLAFAENITMAFTEGFNIPAKFVTNTPVKEVPITKGTMKKKNAENHWNMQIITNCKA